MSDGPRAIKQTFLTGGKQSTHRRQTSNRVIEGSAKTRGVLVRMQIESCVSRREQIQTNDGDVEEIIVAGGAIKRLLG